MQKIRGFKPFDQFSFDGKECFLSGLPATSRIQVFPDWLLDRYQLRDQPFGLLDERVATYGSLQVPCHPVVEKAAALLDDQVRQAFENGYHGLKELSEHELFLWSGKLVLALVYREFEIAAAGQAPGAPLDVAPSLLAKLGNLQLLMQSLFRPVELEHFTPWTIVLTEIEDHADQQGETVATATAGKDRFQYNDEVNTLIFSMEACGAGLIVCFQDNGENGRYHKDLLQKIEEHRLTPIQFRELCARFYYSAYLFTPVPHYLVYPPTDPGEAIHIETMPLQTGASSGTSSFGNWDNKIYAQVLENFWKPWNISRFEILKDPGNPLSCLVGDDGKFKKKCVPPGGDTH